MATKLFDLHIEMGEVQPGVFYAKTILGNNGIMFEHQGPTPAIAAQAVLMDMETSGMWPLMAQNPIGMSQYPFPVPGQRNSGVAPTTTTTTTPPAKKDADPVRIRAVELGSTPKGACEALCISYDNFGAAKCASICKGKK
jgi:hypothetical protein